MLQTLVSLFTVNVIISPKTTLATSYTGSFGQLCPLPRSGAVCSNTSPTLGTDVAMDQVPGYTQCGPIGECCGCASISCGNIETGCNTFFAGDYGAFGVENINIIGRSEQEGGAAINCFGIEACAGSTITATNTSGIYANKDGSMRNARVIITNPIAAFGLYCIGDGSCENAKVELIIPGPPAGFVCNPDRASKRIVWNTISCFGENSCKNMDITINNMGCDSLRIAAIGCYSPTACIGTTFSILGDVSVGYCDLLRPWPITQERFMNENSFCGEVQSRVAVTKNGTKNGF